MKDAKIFLLLLAALAAPAAWAGDKDKDGIPDKYDLCPAQAEDMDGYEDTDGCPDPDNDLDSVLDANDQCPVAREDLDGFQDTDGCPDPDNDKDGIADLKDKCPMAAEDFDGFEDNDGCPEFDNDKDGIKDEADKCTNEPEDMDGFDDTDGCPDRDNDKDGIKDGNDNCPNAPENYNDINDEDGCPDESIPSIQDGQQLGAVDFRTATADLTVEAEKQLDFLARQLAAYPAVKLRVLLFQPFTDSPEAAIALLADRQNAVKDFLVNKGVAGERIQLLDYGLAAYEAVRGTPGDWNQQAPPVVQLVP